MGQVTAYRRGVLLSSEEGSEAYARSLSRSGGVEVTYRNQVGIEVVYYAGEQCGEATTPLQRQWRLAEREDRER